MTIYKDMRADVARLRNLTGVEFYLQTGSKGYCLMRETNKRTGAADPVTTWRGRKAMLEFLNDTLNVVERMIEANELGSNLAHGGACAKSWQE